MIGTDISTQQSLREPRGHHWKLVVLAVVSAVALALGTSKIAFGLTAQILVVAAVSVLAAVTVWIVRRRQAALSHEAALGVLSDFMKNDASPSFVADSEGVIRSANDAATARFPPGSPNTLAASLRAVLANPTAILHRLQCRAVESGSAREDVATRRGHLRVSVHQLANGQFLWRVEHLNERVGGGRGADALPFPMMTIGRSGAVLFTNEAARALIGARVKTLAGLFEPLPIRSGQIHRLQTSDGLKSVLVGEYQSSGGRREIYVHPVLSGNGSNPLTPFENLPVPMLRVDRDGKVLSANRLAAEMLGAGCVEGSELGDLMEGLGRPIDDWLRDACRDSGGASSEFLRLTRRDREMFVQVTLNHAADDEQGELIAVLNDATELKTLEAQFVQSQKMQAIGQLAGGVAHDFNNLLTAISGHCDLLLLRHDPGDQDFGDLTQINENANRAAALVSQLLAFSRKQTLRPEVLDLRDTLSDLTHLLNRLVGEKISLTLSHHPILKPIRADKRQLEQVLMNLVVNARDAMPDGGEIRIETEIRDLAKPLDRDRASVPAGEYVTVTVSDGGTGIPKDKLQKIFEPFFTTKRTGEGTGLGLSTVYGIVKQTGGFIFVDSVEGQGTEFTLYFPVYTLVEDHPVPDAPPQPEPRARSGEGVVLLVEDEAPVRAFASRALRLRGFTVLEAESAEEALDTLQDPELNVDVFVTDVVMPGMDGPTWVRQALSNRPDVRVVFVSGYTEGAFAEAGSGVPNSVFLQKPFSLNQLTETVRQQVH